MIAGSLTVFGALTGYLIARNVPDETAWYPRWFFRFAVLLGLITGLWVTYTQFILGASLWYWLALVGTGLFLVGLSMQSVVMVAVAATILTFFGDLIAWEILTVALIPAVGWLYSRGARSELWWFVLIPSVIIPAAFLA